jgi:hypothetical protein
METSCDEYLSVRVLNPNSEANITFEELAQLSQRDTPP